MFRCPCCGLPTLTEQGAYEICSICWWEDDGQGDLDADIIRGGPNKQYSLTAARRNFVDHGHMYDHGGGLPLLERPSPEREKLASYAHSVSRGELALDEAHLVALIQNERAVR